MIIVICIVGNFSYVSFGLWLYCCLLLFDLDSCLVVRVVRFCLLVLVVISFAWFLIFGNLVLPVACCLNLCN